MSFGSNKPQTLKSLFNDLIETKGWSEKMEELKLPEIWQEAVGEQIAQSAKVLKFENGVLTVTTESSTWRSELKLRTPKLVAKMNEKIGKDIIKTIKIK